MATNLPSTISTMLDALEPAQQATPAVGSGDFSYLKLTRQGEWVYGAEETEVSENSYFVIDPMSYAQGYVAWSADGELIAEEMALAGQPAVTVANLPPLDEGKWDAQVAFALKGIEGAQEGVQVLYKTSSQGGKEAVANLLSQIIARGRAGEAKVCPVVALETTNYKHKKYGKIFKPVLAVDEWMDIPDGADKPEPAPEPAPEPVKAKKAKAIEPPVVDDEPDEPVAPARKRRTRRTA